MKKLFKTFVIEAAVLYLVSLSSEGLVFSQGIRSILLTAGALTVATYLVRPIITILLLPLNLITFGLFKWVSHAIVLFLVDLVLDEFSVVGFRFLGFFSDWISIPTITLPQGALAYIGFSLLLALGTGLLHWIIK